MDFTEANKFIDTFLPTLDTYQTNFIKSSNVYFQCLTSHSQTPVTKTIPDKLNVAPVGKTTKLSDTGLTLNVAMPVSFDVSELVGPLGRGWIVRFYISDGVKKYVRSLGFGVDAKDNTIDWRDLIRY